MLDALTNNFKGYEKLQSKLKAIPKYGVDNDEVDLLGRRLVSDICDIYNSFETRFGGVAKPIILTFLYAPIATSILGARADGRGANFNIAQGLTPNTNSMTAGITAGINSCCKLPFDKLSGGASSMWDIDATWVKEEVLISILKTFLDKNGQIFQGNVISVDDLIKAQKNPENYHHLIVRVGGYSSRFNNLSVEVQNEIISRMRNNC